MNMLYDSESFVVMHILADAADPLAAPGAETAAAALRADIGVAGLGLFFGSGLVLGEREAPRLARHGFEIVDKRSGREIYLDGTWAELFQQQIIAWQNDTPTQEEVEDTLDRYTALAHTPVFVH
jgi:hypothetical protein